MTIHPLINSKLRKIFSFVSKFFAPPICAYCGWFLKEQKQFCQQCSAMIKPVVSFPLKVSKTVEVPVFAVSAYKDPLRSMILAKNYHNLIAAKQLGELMWECTQLKNVEFDLIVPIPLHWTRKVRRGFNQAEEMAKSISKLSGRPVAEVLVRHKRTALQSVLAKEARSDNLKGAFSLFSKTCELYNNKHIVLVDDLMTTGSTLCSAVKTLKSLKPASVSVVVACRVC